MDVVTLTEDQKPAALAALYNSSRPLGMGFLHAKSADMTEAEASELLSETQRFDYLHGRVMKCDFSSDELNLRLYDRDNGQGAGYEALKSILTKKEPA